MEKFPNAAPEIFLKIKVNDDPGNILFENFHLNVLDKSKKKKIRNTAIISS